MKINKSSQFGQNVSWRLQTERIIWLTTVSKNQTPHPRPVWFIWDEDKFLIYSEPNTHKLRHIAANSTVALHFDGDGMGGNIMVFIGKAKIARTMPPANETPEYICKYQDGFGRIQMTADQFSNTYSIPILVEPTKLRGH